MRSDGDEISTVYTFAPSDLFRSGQTVGAPPDQGDERYSPGPELGRGGMGVVRLVYDHWLKRNVAMKRPVRQWGDRFSQQLRQEATVTAELNHPAIARVLDMGVDEEGPFYTMPVLVGRTLADALEAGTLTLPQALDVLIHAAEALCHAHARGVIHRDIKPENIFIGDDGQVWVLDWGVATPAGTPANGLAGTRGYAAPEQSDTPARASLDVYGLGRTLVDVLAALEASSPVLATIVRHSTADVALRWTGVEPFLHALRAFCAGQPVAEHPYGMAEVLRMHLRDHPGAWTLGVLVIAVVGLAGGGALRARQDADREVRRSLAQTLAFQAAEAWRDGREGDAEVLAVASASYHDSSLVRAIAMTPSTGVRRVERHATPCSEPIFTEDGSLACLSGDAVSLHALDGAVEKGWTVHGGLLGQLLAANHERVVVRADSGVHISRPGGSESIEVDSAFETRATSQGLLRSGGRFADPENPTAGWMDVCAEFIEDVVRVPGGYGVTCRRKRVLLGQPGAWRTFEMSRYVHQILRTGDHWVVTSWDGGVAVLEDGEWGWRPSGVGVVAEGVALPSHRVAVLGEQGEVRVFDVRGPTTGVSIPGLGEEVSSVGGDLLVRSSTHVDRWAIPSRPPNGLDRAAEGGVSFVEVSPDRRRLLVGHGTGRQELIELDDGTVTTLVETDDMVAHQGTFFDDDRVVLMHAQSKVLVDRHTLQRRVLPGSFDRHLVRVPGRRLLEYGWKAARLWEEDDTETVLEPLRAAVMDGEDLVALRRDGSIARGPVVRSLETLAERPWATMLLARHGRIWVAGGEKVEEIEPSTGGTRWSIELSTPLTRWVATRSGLVVGDRRGGVGWIGQSGEIRGWMPKAHARRVSGVVEVAPDEVWTASFDGGLRRWALRDAPMESLPTVEARWGQTVDEVLSR